MEQTIRLIPATITDYSTIQNMARFYVYDRTKYMEWSIEEDGMFECIDFKHYFTQPDNKAFIVKVGDELAGFVLLDKVQLISSVDWNMGEFFILAKFQGKGVAPAVVSEVFKFYPGKWSVAVMSKNIKAVLFWRKVISHIAGEKFEEIFKTEEELRSTQNPDPYSMIIFTFNTNQVTR